MFDIQTSEARKVIHVRFHGELSASDFAALDALAGARRGGPQYDCIFDLSKIEKVALAADFVAQRGDLPQAFRDRERIYVVPQEDLKVLTKLYAAYQAQRGWRPPLIVERLEEAFERLNVSAGDFATLEPIP